MPIFFYFGGILQQLIGWIREFLAVCVILIIAAVFRWTALDWDQYRHFHPDERFISWVATTIEIPNEFSGAFDPHLSSFNPYYWPVDAESKGIVVLQDEPMVTALMLVLPEPQQQYFVSIM